MRELLESIDWHQVKNMGSNRLILNDRGDLKDITDEFDKNDILAAGTFVMYNLNEYNETGTAILHKINDRIICPRNSVMIFTEKTVINF